MPKEIHYWRCNDCGRQHSTLERAEKCEERTANVVKYPIGCLYGNHEPGAFYEGLSFAVASNHISGHMNNGGAWAARDNGAGDNYDDVTCTTQFPLTEHDAKLTPDHPTVKRMVGYLKARNIPVTVWGGTEPVPIEEYWPDYDWDNLPDPRK